MSFGSYVGRDYGSNLRQQHEMAELCGMHEDFRDSDYEQSGGPPLSARAMDETTRYPMDGSTHR